MTRPALALLLLAALAPPAWGAGEPLELTARRQPLDPEDPGRMRVGALAYRGGLALASPDSRFGGLSGLVVAVDGTRLTAVTDEGRWIGARIRYDERGWLAGLDGAATGPLSGPDGNALAGKRSQDAEALTALADGAFVVGFERDHRVWRYPAAARPLAGRPVTLPPPPRLGALPANHGLEALATLADGRIVGFAQNLDRAGAFPGYLWDGAGWHELAYPAVGEGFEPTGAARLPNGDLIVLERSFSLIGGPAARLVAVERGQIRPGAALRPRELARLRLPLTVDNYEAVGAARGPAGETLVFLLSDDNFKPWQRTLLLMFALEE